MIGRTSSLAAFVTAVMLAGAAAAAAPSAPPAGRYRCYEPRAQTVVSWFDFEADGTYRFNGGAPARWRYDVDKRVITWIDGGLAEDRQIGLYASPVTPQGGSQRYVIALSQRPGVKPGSKDWSRLVQCYMITH